MNKQRMLAVAAIGLAGAAGVSVGHTQAAAPGRQQWEHLVVGAAEVGGTSGLTRLGSSGWELVAVRTELRTGVTRANGSSTYENESYFYLKRPK